MNRERFFTTGRLLISLIFLGASSAMAQTGWKPASGAFVGWSTNGPAVYRLYVRQTQSIAAPAVAFRPAPASLPPELRGAMVIFRAAAHVTVITWNDKVFDHLLPESLNWLVWTNFIAHTNDKGTLVWSARSRPTGWPRRAPMVQWNSKSLIWGMKGLTAISPDNEVAGNMGQVPITALTRRHGYTLGHAMGPDRIGTLLAGKRVWFLTTGNTLVQTTIRREIVRTSETSRRDYTLVIFSSNLPDTIEPMRVISAHEVFDVPRCRYGYVAGWPELVFQTEQTGNVSAGVPGFTVDTGKGGDSGSPNMLPLPGELVFFSGRTTSGPSREMQADMDTLCRLEGLDPRKYQLQWVDLSAYPAYATE